jgi:hypothetical protein
MAYSSDVFVSYGHQDVIRPLLDKLEAALRLVG